MSAPADISAEKIRALLKTRWLARELTVLGEADSTNRVLASRAADGTAAHGATVIADAQHQGRGRHGRSFFSPAGCNLYSSTLLRAASGDARAGLPLVPTIVLAAGVGVARCVAEELGARDKVSIKWPNDVQIDGRKCSGILLESLGAQDGAVLGIGVNLNLPRTALPSEFRARATTLASALGREVSRAHFAARLYGTLERVLEENARAGFAPVREELESFLHMRGARVRVAELDGRLRCEGTVLGIGASGELRLARDDGSEERVLAGDVTLAPRAGGEQ